MMQYVVNPLFLFWAVWGTALALYAGGVGVGTSPLPQPLTIEVFLLNVGTFSLGYLTWSLLAELPARTSRITGFQDSMRRVSLSSASRSIS